MAERKSEKKQKAEKTKQKRKEAGDFREATYIRDREPAKGEVHGIAAVTRILQGIDFPADKRALIEGIEGRRQFDWVKGHNLDLRPIIEQLPMKRFESATDVTQAVSEYMSQTAGA
jgi:hypothetical protein